MLLIILLVTLVLLPGFSRLYVDSDFEKQLPKTHEIIKNNEYYKEVFGDKKFVFIGIVNEKRTIYNPETLKVIVDFSEGIRKIQGIIEGSIISLADSKYIKGTGDFLDVKLLLESDNIAQTQDEIEALRKAVRENDLFYGKLVSKDETMGIITFDAEGDFDKAKALEILRDLVKKYQTDDIKIHITGATVLQEIDEGIASENAKLVFLAMLLVMVGLFFSFRTLRGVLLPIGLITVANLWILGIIGYIGIAISPITSIVPVMVVVIGGSYAIHAIHRFYESVAEEGVGNLREATKTSMRNMASAVTMAGITSACGALSLLTFKVGSIQDFAVAGAISILICLLLTLAFLPAIFVLLKPPKERTLQKYHGHNRSGLSNFLSNSGDFSMRRKGIVFLVVFILLVGSIVGIAMIQTGQDPIAWFPKQHRVHQAADIFNEKLGGSTLIYAMVDGGEQDSLKKPEVLNYIRQLQEYAIDTLPEVKVTTSFADIIARLNKEMHEGQQEYDKIPESQDLVSQYLLLYSMSGDPEDFDALMMDYQFASVAILFNTLDTNVLKEAYDVLRDYTEANSPSFVKTSLGGINLVYVVLDEYVVKGKLVNMIVTLIMVFVFCTIVFRSFIAGLLGVIPIGMSTLMNFGLMGFLGIRLETSSAIVTGIGVGIGVDFIVHLLFRLKEEARREHDVKTVVTTSITSEGTAIVFDTASNVLAFSVFLTSFLIPIRNFGWLVSFIMINSGFATLFVTPALVHLLKPKFIFARR